MTFLKNTLQWLLEWATIILMIALTVVVVVAVVGVAGRLALFLFVIVLFVVRSPDLDGADGL